MVLVVITLGIDPGIRGAVALLGPGGELLDVHKVPAIRLARLPTYDVPGMRGLVLDLLHPYAVGDIHVAIEGVTTLQPPISRTSNFKLGRGFGLWEGIVAGLELSYELVRPQKWRRGLGVPEGKKGSLVVAGRLWPTRFGRSGDHDKADAALIGEYARRARSG